ncbi:YdiU family protein [Marinomonas sp. M1K-6]|uniref:Protein nucleotidyltransferase YdiU n=1 Tax=Marinomonas profundi TaxID=2726122 RepID=A0A847R211_9GAMM|nr:YdiU family protein [Marinomonas profundi]NLQ16263.1 YdiU family protein [Marinomonas profundi]UDV03160.1 YdiU family protein [Marinomonas profundi]
MNLQHYFANLGSEFSSKTQIQPLHQQRLVEFNPSLATFLSIDIKSPPTKRLLSGEDLVPSSLSMVYAGHQFGGFSAQLGDGRGVLLGEVRGQDGLLYDLHMKGAGPTPYSRRGDGRAVLRSCIREYLASEAMHALSVPSSRALALYDSREAVYRETPEAGAMLLRTAQGHIRFGHFEYFFYQGKQAELDQLIDYCLEHYYPDCLHTESPLESMLMEVVKRTARMIAKWQSVGFQHGVMNTDNFSFSGETIDYGPYGFMEDYEPNWVCNHSDHEGRYAFSRQPGVGLWNLNCLMRCFSKHLERDQLIAILQCYEPELQTHYDALMMKKMGLNSVQQVDELLPSLLTLLATEKMDYSVFFRLLSHFEQGDFALLLDEVVDREALSTWLERYERVRIENELAWSQISAAMLAVNPKFILRNYLAHDAILAAERGDYLPFRRLLNVLTHPFDEHPESDLLAQRAPEWGKSLEVSCSS